MMNAEDYTYRVFRSVEDKAYVATVCEFPSLSCVEDTRDAALAGLTDLVEGVLAWYAEDGETPPVPFGKRSYSGKILLRIPPEQHRRVAIEAAEAGVSLNRLIASRV